MTYTCRVFASLNDLDLNAWERVRIQSGASLFIDPRFLAAVDTAMRPSCRLWYVIVDDDAAQPVACAALAAMTVDLADLADPRFGWIIRRAPVILSRFRSMKVLFCSLPGSPGEKSLALASPDRSGPILASLDRAMCQLAADANVDAVAFKEFRQEDLQWMEPLLGLEYRRIAVPPMHLFDPWFADFAQYCAALKAHYREHINRSIRKIKTAGIEPVVLTDPEEIRRRYTPEVHAMYLEMTARSDIRLEVFPIEYFLQLAARLKGHVELITLMKGERIVAFGWCLHEGATYHMMYAGLDYRLNRQFDLYFNLAYASFDRALRKRVARIHVGQTATAFKSRMGCHSEPLYAFAKGRGALMSRLFHYGANFLVNPMPSNRPANVFKSGFRPRTSAQSRNMAGQSPAGRQQP
jgi:predicted N-acyltransferase